MSVTTRLAPGNRRAETMPLGMTWLAVVALGLLILPLVGLLVNTPWAQLGGLVTNPAVLVALRLSLLTSLSALTLSTVLGVPLAWLLARRDFPAKTLLRALCVLPMVLPPVVGGVALLLAFGRRGLIGQPLDELTGITLPFSAAGVVLAETFVAMPFLIVTVEAGLRAMDRRYEDVAATLGAGRWLAFRRVTLPLLAPSLGAGMALCWARALGEFGATITFAGNLSGRTQTMPLAVYLQLERDLDSAILLSLILLAVSVVVLVTLRGRYLDTG
ncbi:MAG: ABC transporter permease [Actinomycetota bacterium]|jgi:molybdate transport system permease protein|nr:ABC transporter permease [Actinomycetota bacterium]